MALVFNKTGAQTLTPGAGATILQSPAAVCTPMQFEPYTVKVALAWPLATIGLGNGGLKLDLSVQGVANKIDRVRSIEIDNTGCDAAVWVVADDTNQGMMCPPDSIAIISPFSNSLIFYIFLEDTTSTPLCRIFFNNFPLTDTSWDRSRGILAQSSQNSNGGLAIPAIGDLTQNFELDLKTINQFPILNTPTVRKTWITSISCWAFNCFNLPSPIKGQCTIGAGTDFVRRVSFMAPNDMSAFCATQLICAENMNRTLIENTSYTISNDIVLTSGKLRVALVYTQKP